MMKFARSGIGSLEKILSRFLKGVLSVHLTKINKAQLL
jgi:hypothetical protein